ncbi:hypothetical protein [Cardinium endosymbiont of Nabis limbatus]|uniref:hypothetical protein n=1 Tax=Cardinium endosymbiont of Nabis limbatus TaxID=3066217 RepID=UPI003AF3954C
MISGPMPNSSDSSKVVKPVGVSRIGNSEAIRTVRKLADEAEFSVNESDKIVSQRLKVVISELDKLQKGMSVLHELRKHVQFVSCKSEEKYRIAQQASRDVQTIVEEIDIADRADASDDVISVKEKMVNDMMSIVQDVKNSIVCDKQFLEKFNEKLAIVKKVREDLRPVAVKAVETAQKAVQASTFAIGQINMKPEAVKKAQMVSQGKDVLEFVTEVNKKGEKVLDYTKK